MKTLALTFFRPYGLIALLVLGWGALKLSWEYRLELEQRQRRYQGVALTRGLRDQLGQGATIATLAGMRALVANYFWLMGVEPSWERREWFRLKSFVELATTLEPRSVSFWKEGSNHFAFDAALDCRRNPNQPIELLRLRDERYWVDQAVDFLQRGIENNPEQMDLWYQIGYIYEQRKKDYLKAAYYYQEALKRPHPPQFLERFAGYDLEKGGNLTEAYEWWKKIWFSTTDRTERFRAWDVVEKHLRNLEEKLGISPEKRVFPETKIRESQEK